MEYKYYIYDHTDKEIIYFFTLEEAYSYANYWNHNMTLCRRTLSSWEEIDYFEREEK